MSSDPSQRDARWRRLAVAAFGLAAVLTVGTVAYNSRQGAAPGAPPRADGGPGPAAMGRPGPMGGATSHAAEACSLARTIMFDDVMSRLVLEPNYKKLS